MECVLGPNLFENFILFYETILFSLFDRVRSSNQFLYLQCLNLGWNVREKIDPKEIRFEQHRYLRHKQVYQFNCLIFEFWFFQQKCESSFEILSYLLRYICTCACQRDILLFKMNLMKWLLSFFYTNIFQVILSFGYCYLQPHIHRISRFFMYYSIFLLFSQNSTRHKFCRKIRNIL